MPTDQPFCFSQLQIVTYAPKFNATQGKPLDINLKNMYVSTTHSEFSFTFFLHGERL